MRQVIILTILLLLIVSYTFSQEKNSQPSITLRYESCERDLAVFVLENKSRRTIYARVHPVPYWEEWKKANAQFGTFTSEYKASEADEFINVGDRFDAPHDFTTIRPGTKIRYGIPLRRSDGIYKVSVPYIGNLRMKKMLDFGNLTSEEFDLISWKEVTSKETFITCK